MNSGPIIGVEVGVAAGNTSEALLRENQKLKLWMVDSWLGADQQPEHYRNSGDGHGRYPQAEQDAHFNAAQMAVSFAGTRAEIIRLDSVSASALFGNKSLDFVFIDADHTYEGCSSDIEAWKDKIKPDGYLCGHDYYNEPPQPLPWATGVKKAVDEASEKNGWRLELGGNYTWFVRM